MSEGFRFIVCSDRSSVPPRPSVSSRSRFGPPGRGRSKGRERSSEFEKSGWLRVRLSRSLEPRMRLGHEIGKSGILVRMSGSGQAAPNKTCTATAPTNWQLPNPDKAVIDPEGGSPESQKSERRTRRGHSPTNVGRFPEPKLKFLPRLDQHEPESGIQNPETRQANRLAGFQRQSKCLCKTRHVLL